MQIGAAIGACKRRRGNRGRAARGSSAWRALRRLTVPRAGEGLRGAARARRQHAIEHVDAAHDRADDVGGLADAHQIARPVRRQGRHGRVEHREHRRLPLADRQPADRIAVEADLDQPCRRSLAQIGINAALHDAEDAVPGRSANARLRALGPAHRQVHRASPPRRGGGIGRAFVERHRRCRRRADAGSRSSARASDGARCRRDASGR